MECKELKEIYEEQFNILKYEDFLNKLLNQKIVVDSKSRDCFQFEVSFAKKWNSNFINAGDCNGILNYRMIKEKMTDAEWKSFNYLLFKKGYFILLDDYSGIYSIKSYKKL